MRRGKVFVNGTFAGIITEDENGYHFVYQHDYLLMPDAEQISLTMPLREEPYESKVFGQIQEIPQEMGRYN